MTIKDLKPNQGNVDIIADVVDKGEIREFSKFGKSGKVCNATLKDETGEVKLTLWNEDIDLVHIGDKIHIEKGFVNEFRGELQLTKGKFGKMEIIESKGAAAGKEEESQIFSNDPKQADEDEQMPSDEADDSDGESLDIEEEVVE